MEVLVILRNSGTEKRRGDKLTSLPDSNAVVNVDFFP